MTRLPVLRTFALTVESRLGVDWTYRVQAESREAAAKQLADMLEEVG